MKRTCQVDMPWGACGKEANHVLHSGDPGDVGLLMCNDHWEQASALEAALRANPKLAEEFERLVDQATAKTRPPN